MKFAQYLEDAQAPEWKKAYLDYRGLKKLITAVRRSQPGRSFHLLNSDDSPDDSPQTAPKTTVVIEDSSNVVDGLVNHKSSKSAFGMKIKGMQTNTLLGKGTDLSGPSKRFGNLPLHEILVQLSPQESAFFSMLDTQLDNVETFYVKREKEMLAREHDLRIQLKELKDHRSLFHETHSTVPWIGTTSLPFMSIFHDQSGGAQPAAQISYSLPETEANLESISSGPTAGSSTLLSAKTAGKQKDPEVDISQVANEESGNPRHMPISADAEGYLNAKRKLKKAVLEHYRGLELLYDYRVLNVTAFRKALKKFEKVTKIQVQRQYMIEKVDKSAFASDKMIERMMCDVEEMFATTFVHGDRRKANKLLRLRGKFSTTHHFSTFRSGVFIGLAIPVLVDGIVKAYQPQVRRAIPAWNALLFIYGLLFVPVLFSFLVGINMIVWAHTRINYPFIFELDVRTKIDYRQYFEIPAILFLALTCSFWLSFSQAGVPHLSPSKWPVIWLGFTGFIILNPFPIIHKSSRYWLIKNLGKQLISGTRPVEFADFWMGDQFCSLIFSLSHVHFAVCVYKNDFAADWEKCGSSSNNWPIAFVIAVLPLFIRLVQSVKRFADSELITHLINGGKYGSGIISYLFYFLWRRDIYALGWDLLMDWSVLRLHTPHFLLRSELIYENYIPLYYVAIILNILLRFVWVIYIPKRGPNMMVRAFIAGTLEVIRRWIWNFFRLENEHIGNVDQYRATRELPLPYTLDDTREEDGDEDEKLKLKQQK